MKYAIPLFVTLISLLGCGKASNQTIVTEGNKLDPTTPVLVGKWIKESDGSIMLNPQTSGLAHWRGKLLSLSDGSADASQIRRIHILSPDSATLAPKPQAMKMASRVRRSCFANYLANQPDLEALAVDPDDDNIFYMVTEDATRDGVLSSRCQTKYANTGSTDYPTVLVRVARSESGESTMTHVRPLRFASELEVGNFPNDGIEGLAITPEKLLYLGLEKDKQGKARIFSVQLNDAFWQTTDFADVLDPKLNMPETLEGNHPINGLAYFSGKLFAAARNDNEIWIIDTLADKPAKQVRFDFAATIENDEQGVCGNSEIMDNASIEGLAVIDNTLWMVNDPWKKNYLKNIKCEANAANYQALAPLLFSTPILPSWLE